MIVIIIAIIYHKNIFNKIRIYALKKISLAPQALDSLNNQIPLPSSLGNGHIHWYQFKSGIQLLAMDYTPRESIAVEWTPPSTPLGFGFCLSGSIQAQLTGQKERRGIKTFKFYPNTSSANYSPAMASVTETYRPERVTRVAVFMDLKQFFLLADEQMNFLTTQLEKKPTGIFRFEDTVTAAMYTTISQILNCPYQGAARNLFLEGKVLELVAHKIGQMDAAKGTPSSLKPLLASDVERVHEATRLLVSNLESPPDVNTLAHTVGLSPRSLYRHFHKIHGMAPFDYLRNYRLNMASELLRSQKANVSEAAFLVGYSSVSHFSKVFKSMFGVLPSDFRKSSSTIFL